MRKLFKVSCKIFLIIVALGLLHLSILASPQKIFKHHMSFGKYEVYSDSTITTKLMSDVFDANERIRSSEFYDSNFRANIFFCADPDLYNSILFLIGMKGNSSGVNLSVFNNTFINLNRINRMKAFHDLRISYSHLTGTTSQIIAHELTHNLVGNYLGFFKAKELPRWKAEGYSEYISTISAIRNDESDSYLDRCKLYYNYNLFNVNPHSKFYYKSQLITEFLFEYQDYSFDQFYNNELNNYDAEVMLKDWIKKFGRH